MKVLILAIMVTWSFSGGYQSTPTFQTVSSPQEAAIRVWQDKRQAISVEADQKEYSLYQVDLKSKTIENIDIPEVFFGSVPKNQKADLYDSDAIFWKTLVESHDNFCQEACGCQVVSGEWEGEP